jgi:CRISPR-associated protein Csm2
MNLNKFEPKWIAEKLETSAIDFAEEFGKYLCDIQTNDRGQIVPGRMAMTTTQIRNFFGEVKRIQAKGFKEEESAFLLIRPKLAYAEARVLQKTAKSRISDFKTIMDKSHKAVDLGNDKDKEDQFQRFVDFLEAILAYHKANGGRD